MEHLNFVLLGAVIMTSFVASLFFLKFWKTTHDRFFLFFAGSFFLDGISRMIAATINNDEYEPLVYVIRLLAFLMILIAIADKNRSKGFQEKEKKP